MTSIGVV